MLAQARKSLYLILAEDEPATDASTAARHADTAASAEPQDTAEAGSERGLPGGASVPDGGWRTAGRASA